MPIYKDLNKYSNLKKYNDIPNQRRNQREESYTNLPIPNKEKRTNDSDDLIIEDNTIYEVDQECYEKMKKKRLTQRKEWDDK